MMEQFSFEMQTLLEDYQAKKITIEELDAAYKQIGTEGHDVLGLKPFLELARENADKVKLFGGFIPRTYARQVMREGLEAGLTAAKEKAYVRVDEALEGSDEHYNMFESMISGRDMHNKETPATDQFRKMFPAQLIKDASMANKVNELLKIGALDTTYYVICGTGHMQYGYGVPERIWAANETLKQSTSMVVAYEADGVKFDVDTEHLEVNFGTELSPADFCFLFADTKEEEDVKGETAAAYDKVGDTAHREGNLRKAEKVMKSINYSQEEFEIAGQDAYNFQGVNNPHNLAKVQPGETVLDLGSGLAVDSFIAAARTGETGKVIGLDLSKSEVIHANKRAAARGISDRVSFIQGDMEKMTLDSDMFDCVISNGAFCLAPSKKAAFSEIFRVLKPGGRFSVSTSTMKVQIDQADGKQWPICMRMFVQLDDLKPICESCGFTDVLVDMSNSEMQFEIEEEEGKPVQKESKDKKEEQQKEPKEYNEAGRRQIHGASKEFDHLREYDINAMCARVTVFGRKPST